MACCRLSWDTGTPGTPVRGMAGIPEEDVRGMASIPEEHVRGIPTWWKQAATSPGFLAQVTPECRR